MADSYGYVPITKSEKTDDGTLIVTGVATDSSLDRSYQIADAAWLDKAMPAWFREGANIREQHDGKRAAGVAIEYTKNDSGQHVISAEIVDPLTIKKIEKGVLRGFSFGATNARVTTDKSALGGRIIDGTINEVSVVDRPCNAQSMFTIAKADASGDLRPVEEPVLEDLEKAEEKFTPTQFAEILKNLGKTPTLPVPPAPVEDPIAEVLDKVKSLVPDLTKADDETLEIGDASAAIACIARLIISEAESLAQGNFNEIYDIRTLTEAACALEWFVSSERYEEIDMADKTETPEVTKTEETEETAPVVTETAPAELDVEKTEESELVETLTKADIATLLEDAITKATQPYKDEVALVKAELTKVLETPVAGGPARTRTVVQKAEAAKTDQLRIQIAYLRKSVSETGGDLQVGYRERLKAAESELLKLDGQA